MSKVINFPGVSVTEAPTTPIYTTNPTTGYMGMPGYRGSNAFRNLYGAELSKAIRAALKSEKIRGVTVRASTYSMGQSITLTIKATHQDYVPMGEYIHHCEWRDIAPFDWVEDPLKPGKQINVWNIDNPEYAEALRMRLAEKHMRDFMSGNQQLNHYYLDRFAGVSG